MTVQQLLLPTDAQAPMSANAQFRLSMLFLSWKPRRIRLTKHFPVPCNMVTLFQGFSLTMRRNPIGVLSKPILRSREASHPTPLSAQMWRLPLRPDALLIESMHLKSFIVDDRQEAPPTYIATMSIPALLSALMGATSRRHLLRPVVEVEFLAQAVLHEQRNEAQVLVRQGCLFNLLRPVGLSVWRTTTPCPAATIFEAGLNRWSK